MLGSVQRYRWDAVVLTVVSAGSSELTFLPGRIVWRVWTAHQRLSPSFPQDAFMEVTVP